MPGMRLRCICRGHYDTIGRTAWSPCGRFIASPSQDHTIRIWDANNGKCLEVLRDPSGSVNCVSWSNDGQTLASGRRGTVCLWDLQTSSKSYAYGKIEHTISVGESAVNALCWSPNEPKRLLAAVGSNLCQIDTTTALITMVAKAAHEWPINCLECAP